MKLTRFLSIALAALLLVGCLLIGGCSTPEFAMEVNGKKYTTGEYLAYLYAVVSSDSNLSNSLYTNGLDALNQQVTYKEQSMIMSDYLHASAQDAIIRQEVVEKMRAEYGIEWDADELKKVEEELKDLPSDAFIAYGFNNQRYIDMYKRSYLSEASLFLGLYEEGGDRAVPETELRTFFEENHMSFKIIEISLVNSDKTEKTEAEIKKIEERLQGYLDAFNKTDKKSADFDKTIYAPYLADEEKAKTTTTTKAGATTTTAASTTTTTTTTTTTVATTTTTTASGSTDNNNKTESTTDSNTEKTAERYDLFKDEFADEDLFKAIKEIEMGSAAIKTYQKGGTTKTMSLIFRMDPEAERTETDEDGKTTEIDYYKENHDYVLKAMKQKEFNEEIEKKMAEMEKSVVRYNKTFKAIKLDEMILLMYAG